MATASLKDYLKRYESAAEEQKKKKKKKKEEKKPKSELMGGVRVVDEDPVWQKPILEAVEEEEDDSAGDEKPQIDEDIEVKRLRRLEAIRLRKPYLAISDDGSGWISVSDSSKLSNSTDRVPNLSPERARSGSPSPGAEQKPGDSGNSDLSPPRPRRRRFHTPSPERESELQNSRDGVADMSPPRRQSRERVRRRSPEAEASRASPDLSPPRRIRRGSPDDLSPPRRVHRHPQESSEPLESPAADLSPPRRSRKDLSGDLLPPRPVHRHSRDTLRPSESTAADLSPPRRSRKGSSDYLSGKSPADDLSPPRKSRKEPSLVKEARRAGLFSGQEIKQEIDKKRKEELSRFASMDPILSGRGAEPVYRDKEGKRMSKEDILKLQKEEEKPKEKKLEWGKGLAQKREVEAREQELELERNKPFARTRDDPDLDKMFKETTRWGDPMAHLVKKKHSELVLEDFGDNEKMKESGFIIPQTIPSHSWIKRGIDFPPNRYGIRPGRHWDGVDRSNGTEQGFFKRQNEKKATEAEAYLWSVSDM